MPVRLVPARLFAPKTRVLARVMVDGYFTVIVGRSSDLSSTLEWLNELESWRRDTPCELSRAHPLNLAGGCVNRSRQCEDGRVIH